jgi:hypothetical protein
MQMQEINYDIEKKLTYCAYSDINLIKRNRTQQTCPTMQPVASAFITAKITRNYRFFFSACTLTPFETTSI